MMVFLQVHYWTPNVHAQGVIMNITGHLCAKLYTNGDEMVTCLRRIGFIRIVTKFFSQLGAAHHLPIPSPLHAISTETREHVHL